MVLAQSNCIGPLDPPHPTVLDESKPVNAEPLHHQFNGLEIPLRSFSGAKAARVVHPREQRIETHRHDWACITLPVIGQGQEEFDGGEAQLEGPSAVIHPAGAVHADSITRRGLETVSIQFDPAWLRAMGQSVRLDRTYSCAGGRIGVAARRLASVWTSAELTEPALASEVVRFLHVAVQREELNRPAWLIEVGRSLISGSETTAQLARRLDLHPAWVTRAYRRATGEGVQDSVRRKRVEEAVAMIRTTATPLADVAAAAGFCDQSYMNRTFAAVLGRTPLQVRSECVSLKPFSPT